MLTRFASSPGVGALLSTIALASVLLLANGADGRARLESSVLEQSRGHNLLWTLTQSNCELQNGIEPCPPNSLGASCAFCVQKWYTDVQFQGAGYGGYTTVPAVGDCGRLIFGFCDENQNCEKDYEPDLNCVKPFNVDLQEGGPPDGSAD